MCSHRVARVTREREVLLGQLECQDQWGSLENLAELEHLAVLVARYMSIVRFQKDAFE